MMFLLDVCLQREREDTFNCFVLGQVNQWCESGIYLLASQVVDKCQSQEGAESALTDIEGFLESEENNQLTKLKNLHNQYEVVLSEEIKVRTHTRTRGTLLLAPCDTDV